MDRKCGVVDMSDVRIMAICNEFPIVTYQLAQVIRCELQEAERLGMRHNVALQEEIERKANGLAISRRQTRDYEIEAKEKAIEQFKADVVHLLNAIGVDKKLG